MTDPVPDAQRPQAKKRRPGCLIIFLVVLALPLLWYNAASTKIEKENEFRLHLFQTVVTAINSYFQAHQRYPDDLSLLHINQQNIVEEYEESGVLDYYRDPLGSEWYTFTCRYSGIVASGSGRHRVGWSGIQYSNQKDKLPLPPGTNGQPGDNGFYFADFH